MKVLLAETDLTILNKTKNILERKIPGITLIETAQTIQELNLKLDSQFTFDLILTEIRFSDGLFFDAFENRNLNVPIIFTNNSAEFALRAFDFNCVDYILKPAVEDRLIKAFSKFKNLYHPPTEGLRYQNEKLGTATSKTFKKRFLTKVGNKIRFVSAEDISYLFSEDGLSYLVEKGSNQKSILDHGMIELETVLLDPSKFYRINRSVIINSEDLMEMKPYLNSRLILTLKSKSQQELVVARERVSDFKKWINQ
jgi:DNA-binding LytR/AlgR family response regulator